MESVEALEAETQFTAILERVAKGERFTITRRGKPVAQLVPLVRRDLERVKAAIAGMEENSAGLRLDEDWREFRDAGRKW